MFRLKDFSASHAQPARRPEGHKKLGGNTVGAADPNWPKEYSIPCDIMSSIETGVSGGRGIAAWGLTGRQLVGGEQLHCASFVYSNPFTIVVVILLVLSLSLLVSSFLFY